MKRLDRRRRHARSRSMRAVQLRPADDDGDHRRPGGPLPAVRGPLPPRLQPIRRVRHPAAASACIRRAMSPQRTPQREGGTLAGLQERFSTGSDASAAGPRPDRSSNSNAEAAEGALYVGAPETVARKIAGTVKALGVSAVRDEIRVGHHLPHEQLMSLDRAFRHRRVAPLVRDMLA
jgi:hypothetical protein